MSKVLAGAKRFLRDEGGPTAVEYAVLLAMIIIVCIASVQALGSYANNTFTYVGAVLGGTAS
jgi:pilus assembly protein Flp/PilA